MEQKRIYIFSILEAPISKQISIQNRLRSYLQTMSSTSKGQRGFIYPFKIAQTNNPGNYRVEYDGTWEGYRCSVRKDSVAWGLSGVTAVFKDSIAHIKIKANGNNYHENLYDFDRIRVFYDNWSEDYQIAFKEDSLVTLEKQNKNAHYIEYALSRKVDEVEFCVQKIADTTDAKFLLMGIELMNDNKGIQYTSIGVNGGSFCLL